MNTFKYMFAGVGVDIRVNNTIVFGLSETIEDLLQEGGRSMRGGDLETKGKTGYSFFFHKGALGKLFICTCSSCFPYPYQTD